MGIRNLLSSELHENRTLYDRAVHQWKTVVFGATLLVADYFPVMAGVAEAKRQTGLPVGPAVVAGVLAVAGTAVGAFGMGQLRETSRALDESLATQPQTTAN